LLNVTEWTNVEAGLQTVNMCLLSMLGGSWHV